MNEESKNNILWFTYLFTLFCFVFFTRGNELTCTKVPGKKMPGLWFQQISEQRYNVIVSSLKDVIWLGWMRDVGFTVKKQLSPKIFFFHLNPFCKIVLIFCGPNIYIILISKKFNIEMLEMKIYEVLTKLPSVNLWVFGCAWVKQCIIPV